MLDKLKNIATMATDELKNRIDTAQTPKRYIMTYDAGLPDVKGPKLMTLDFTNNSLVISYGFFLFPTKITITPNDILELDLGVQNTDQTANAMVGAMTGKVLGGSLGAIGLASLSAKRKREDHLHLVVNYKGEARTIYFQSKNNFQKLYSRLKTLADLRTTPLKNKAVPGNETHNLSQSNNIDYTKQLSDLHGLLEKGILTQSEFDTKKGDILSKM